MINKDELKDLFILHKYILWFKTVAVQLHRSMTFSF